MNPLSLPELKVKKVEFIKTEINTELIIKNEDMETETLNENNDGDHGGKKI